MKQSKSKRRVATGGIVVAALLALASVAWACTVFRGQMKLTAGGGTSVAVGDPGSGMVLCASPAPTSGANVTANGTMKVEVAPATCGTNTSDRLAKGTSGKYAITYLPIKNATAALDCMNATIPKGSGILVGTMTISDGTGNSGNFTPASPVMARPGTNALSVCVSSLPRSAGGAPVSPAEGMLVNAGYMVI